MMTNLDNQHVPRLLAAFRERLIDLTRRNRLINYRHSESSNTHVRIVDCGLNDLIGEIIQGTQLEFTALPEATAVLDDEGGSEFRAAFESAALSDPEYLDRVQRQNMDGSSDPEFQAKIERSLKDRVRTQLSLPSRQGPEFASPTAIARAAGIDPSYHLELDTHRASEDRLRRIQTLFLPQRMEAKLGKIRDSAQRSIEESGVNRLYLAVGFLEWHEAEQSDRSCYAPLLVIPVTIERQSSSNRWRYFMRGTGEPLTDNVALRLRLRDEGLDLPEFGEGGKLGNYLEQVGNAIQEKNGWTVHLFATVGLFAFANIEIWNDLDPDNWPNGSLSEHPNILSLFGGGEPSPEIFAEEYQIDSPEVSAELPPLILNADSSQLSTIIDALGKRNLAVKGPPGTGKSQTIANLIAAALFRGEKVLFLAEKMAALEVVKSRLDDAGLGDFVLELHSSKANTRNVIAGLNQRMEQRIRTPKDFQSKIEQLESLKHELNEYVRLINSPAAKTGKTIHEVLWACQNRRNVLSDSAFRGLDIANAEQMGLVELERAETALDIFESAAKDIEMDYRRLSDHPWSWIGEAVEPFSRDSLIDLVSEGANLMEQLDDVTKRLSNLGIGANLDSPALLSDLIDFIARIPVVDGDVLPPLLLALADNNVRDAIGAFSELLVARNRSFDDLSSKASVDATIGQVDKLNGHLAKKSTEIDCEIAFSQVPGARESVVAQIDLVQQAQSLERAIAEVFDVRGSLNRNNIELLLEAAEMIFNTSDRALELKSEHLDGPRALVDLEAASSRAQQLLQWKETLSQQFQLDALDSPESLREDATVIKTTGFLGRMSPVYRRARRRWVSIARGDHKEYRSRSKDPQAMARDLEELASSVGQEQNFVADERLRELVTLDFRGLDTDFSTWVDAAFYMNAARDLSQVCEESGLQIRHLLQKGSDADLSRIKRLVTSGATTQLKEGMIKIGLGATRTLGHELAELESQKSWWVDFEEMGALAGLVEETKLKDIEGILNEVRAYHELCSQINESSDVLGILEASAIDPNDAARGIQATLDFSDQLRLVFPEDTPWSSGFLFTENVREITTGLKEISSQLTDWMVKSTALLDQIDGVSSIEFTEGHIRTENRSFVNLRERFEKCKSDPASLGSWSRLLEASAGCSELKLDDFVERYDSACKFKLAEAYQAVYWRSLAGRALQQYPVLRRFSGETQARARARFKELDAEILYLNRERIASSLSRLSPAPGVRQGLRTTWTEMSLIRVLLPQQRPRVKIRDLVRRAGRSLQALQPCFMMSPSSVAQFLEPGSVEFGLVIIDEASQMRPEEAIGSIARSRQSVIVGDPMQLPPTPFFNRVDTLDEDLEEDIEDESILDRALASFSPYRELRWHYRSRHQDLIRFSNKHFYQDRLIVFPSAEETTHTDLGVRFHKVDATYMGRGANPQEAQHVAAAAIRALKERPDWSLGIAAVNKEQTDLIRAEFDQMLLRDSTARRIWDQWSETLYPGFIKNLENVQGDERDRIIISTVYGPNANGRVLQQFGPIVNQSGHRRLNVLYTRAKQRVDLYSSMSASDIRTDERSSLGLRAFHGYLDYAATLRLDSGNPTTREPDSEFEIYVADALRSAGYEAVPQVGAGNYFIDVGVRHPSYPHGFLAGIECDGAMYHSAKSAKDRDALRQAVLEDLGWTIYRVWSTDWFNDPRGETQKLVFFLEQLRDKKTKPTVIDDGLPWQVEVEQFVESDDDHFYSQEEPTLLEAESGMLGHLLDETQATANEKKLTDELNDVAEPLEESDTANTRRPTIPILSAIANDLVLPPAMPESGPLSRDSLGESLISIEQARQQLIRFREDQIQKRFRNTPRDRGLLRRGMIEALLGFRPTTKEEFQRDIPLVLRLKTDANQSAEYLDSVLAIIRQVIPY